MNEMRIFLLCIGVLILIVNFFINFSNIFKIVVFCFHRGSVSQYWNLFFKTCVSGKAIISSIIGFVLALIIFFLILPFVLLKGSSGTYSDTNQNFTLNENSNHFIYTDLALEGQNKTFQSNINPFIPLDLSSINVTGKLRIDAIMCIADLQEKCTLENKSMSYEVMHKVSLVNNSSAIIPLLITLENQKLPAFFIYTEEQRKQYRKVKSLLFDSGYKQCLYFSIIPM